MKKVALIFGVTGQDGAYLAKLLVEKGYDRTMGARPMERVIQEHIKKPLADLVLFGELSKGGTASVVLEPDGAALRVVAVTENQEALTKV